MRPRLLLCAAFIAFLGTAAYAETMVWKFKSLHPNSVVVKLHSQSRSHVWPASDESWVLNDYNVHSVSISCQRGEKICYGAAVQGSGSPVWGVDLDNSSGCQGCCYTCGQRNLNVFILNP